MADHFIVVVANYKGGVGKSTIAAHIACHLVAALIDIDTSEAQALFDKARARARR